MTEPTHFDTGAREWDQRPTSLQLAAVPRACWHRFPSPPPTACWTLAQAPVCWPPPSPACGTGHRAGQLRPHAAGAARKGFANITTLQRDIFDGLPERYDAIVSCMAMHHVPDTRALLQAFADALQPGGRIALVDLYAEDGSFHGDNAAKGVHHLGFAPDALQALAEQAGLQGIAFTEVLRVHRPNGREYPLFLMTGHKP